MDESQFQIQLAAIKKEAPKLNVVTVFFFYLNFLSTIPMITAFCVFLMTIIVVILANTWCKRK